MTSELFQFALAPLTLGQMSGEELLLSLAQAVL